MQGAVQGRLRRVEQGHAGPPLLPAGASAWWACWAQCCTVGRGSGGGAMELCFVGLSPVFPGLPLPMSLIPIHYTITVISQGCPTSEQLGDL